MSSMTVPQPATPIIDIRSIVNLTARLAQLLAEEVDLLGDMKVSKIEALQEEKIFLTNSLNQQKRILEKYPHNFDTIPSQDKRDLENIVEVFNDILAENHRKLLLAKEVNHQIVRAITDVVKENTLSKTYDDQGMKHADRHASLSVTLNQTI